MMKPSDGDPQVRSAQECSPADILAEVSALAARPIPPGCEFVMDDLFSTHTDFDELRREAARLLLVVGDCPLLLSDRVRLRFLNHDFDSYVVANAARFATLLLRPAEEVFVSEFFARVLRLAQDDQPFHDVIRANLEDIRAWLTAKQLRPATFMLLVAAQVLNACENEQPRQLRVMGLPSGETVVTRG